MINCYAIVSRRPLLIFEEQQNTINGFSPYLDFFNTLISLRIDLCIELHRKTDQINVALGMFLTSRITQEHF